MSEHGLGKGLGALLGSAALNSQPDGLSVLKITEIEPNRYQPRKYFEESSLAALSDSIKIHGILQPLTVRRLSSGYYQIIAGERRWRAARLAGLTEIPAVIVEADDRKAMELALIENLQREDLNPIEEAEGYRTLIEYHGLTQEEAAARVGKSRPAVSNTLRLLSLSDGVKTRVERGDISGGHARALLPLRDPRIQEAAADAIVRGDLSVRQTEAYVKNLRPRPEAVPSPHNIHIAALEKELTKDLSHRVRIRSSGNRGRIEIEYYENADLDSLVEMLRAISKYYGK